MSSSDNETFEKNVKLAEKLQTLVMEDFVRLAENQELTPTDRRTIVQLLQQNGWTLDPTKIPQGIRDKLKNLRIDAPERPDVDDDIPEV